MSTKELESFADRVRDGARRWLHSIDLDPSSLTYGVADREFWAWKTKDFANGTHQAGLAGFFDFHSVAPLFTDAEMIGLTRAIIKGTRTIQRSNGSFEEAYPRESSYCVTALVLFGLLYAYKRRPDYFETDVVGELGVIVRQAMSFLDRQIETHGEISNHLATAALARLYGRRFMDAPLQIETLSKVLALQREEGWFPEYGGADPGYQTLLHSYLIAGSDVAKLCAELPRACEASLAFSRAFAFPEGSYSGEIGSRGTSIVYPLGTFSLDSAGRARPTPFTTWFVNDHLRSNSCVDPIVVDTGNFVPVFNSWAASLRLLTAQPGTLPAPEKVPSGRTEFPGAGLFVFRTPEAVVAFSKSQGSLRRFVRSQGQWRDESVVGLRRGRLTTQGAPVVDFSLGREQMKFEYAATERHQQLNSIDRAIVLRLLAVLLYPFLGLQRFMKAKLAAFVMKESGPVSTGLSATLHLDSEELSFLIHGAEGWTVARAGFHTHMASANTFDDRRIKT